MIARLPFAPRSFVDDSDAKADSSEVKGDERSRTAFQADAFGESGRKKKNGNTAPIGRNQNLNWFFDAGSMTTRHEKGLRNAVAGGERQSNRRISPRPREAKKNDFVLWVRARREKNYQACARTDFIRYQRGDAVFGGFSVSKKLLSYYCSRNNYHESSNN